MPSYSIAEEATSRELRVVRRLPYPAEEVWNALIRDCELDGYGALLPLAFIGEHRVGTARIMVYESRKVLECSWDDCRLRWELDGGDGATSVTFTYTRTGR